jgi:uncharacterized tellurite resistance protein B-like protein
MLGRVADFLVGLVKPAPSFPDGDHRVAAAALLVHAIGVDGAVTRGERDRLAGLIEARFAVSPRLAREIIAAGAIRARESVDLTDFTHPLKRVLEPEGRVGVVDMLWDVVLVDGRVRELEESFVWRVAELLGVPASQIVSLRRKREDA